MLNTYILALLLYYFFYLRSALCVINILALGSSCCTFFTENFACVAVVCIYTRPLAVLFFACVVVCYSYIDTRPLAAVLFFACVVVC